MGCATSESTGRLCRLCPGAAQISSVFNLGSGGFAWWLAASGHSVRVKDQPRPVSKLITVWELRGPLPHRSGANSPAQRLRRSSTRFQRPARRWWSAAVALARGPSWSCRQDANSG